MIAKRAPFVFETSIQNYFDLTLRACLFKYVTTYTVIPRLTSDPAKNFSANEEFFAGFWTRLKNMDSANECFSGCAR
jgi:hypothetical protein